MVVFEHRRKSPKLPDRQFHTEASANANINSMKDFNRHLKEQLGTQVMIWAIVRHGNILDMKIGRCVRGLLNETSWNLNVANMRRVQHNKN